MKHDLELASIAAVVIIATLFLLTRCANIDNEKWIEYKAQELKATPAPTK